MDIIDEDIKKILILDWIKNYAHANRWTLNQNEQTVSTIIRGLLNNERRYGELYCPCRIVSRDTKKDVDIICPCKTHRAEIETDGHCHCKLYFRDVLK
jgi:ferredoxin-thioredoxin reductase catalytic subunit